MNHSLSKFSKSVTLLLGLLPMSISISQAITTQRNLTIPHNIFAQANVTIDRCSTLFVDKIAPNTTFDPLSDCTATSSNSPVCFTTNIAINPCQKLLTNRIDAIQEVDGICLEDSAGTVCFDCTTAVNPNRSLLVNTICPVATGSPDLCGQDTCVPNDDICATTNFCGAVKIESSRVMGQTNTVRLVPSQSTRLLCLTFDRCSNNPSDPNFANGAAVTIKFHGIVGGNNSGSGPTSFFDVFIEFDALVGPGNSFNSHVLGDITVASGSPFVPPTPTVSFQTDSLNPCRVWISLNIGSFSVEDFEFSCLDGVSFYEVVSNNLSSITCPSGSLPPCEENVVRQAMVK